MHQLNSSDKQTIITIPTLNERDNVIPLIERIYELKIPGLGVVVVDDASKDGTAEAIARLTAKYTGLKCIKRRGKMGRGLSNREGYTYCLEQGADFIIEMDGDGSHDPEAIPQMLIALRTCDIALGSRLCPGGKDTNRDIIRQMVTKASNAYVQLMFNTTLKDCNTGYRAFSRKAMEIINPYTLQCEGASVIHEVLWRAIKAGLIINEIPIKFYARMSGESKLGLKNIVSRFLWIWGLRFGKI